MDELSLRLAAHFYWDGDRVYHVPDLALLLEIVTGWIPAAGPFAVLLAAAVFAFESTARADYSSYIYDLRVSDRPAALDPLGQTAAPPVPNRLTETPAPAP